MALGWLTVLQSVPWSEVIRNAPKVADGAKKLWGTVAGKPAAPEVADAATPPAGTPESVSLAALEARASTLEAKVADLHAQMLASSELIQALAEQNAQLIQRSETQRRHMLWLGAATTLAAIAALLGLFLRFLPQ